MHRDGTQTRRHRLGLACRLALAFMLTPGMLTTGSALAESPRPPANPPPSARPNTGANTGAKPAPRLVSTDLTAAERNKLGECVALRESRCVLEILGGRAIERDYLVFGESEGLRLRHYVLSVAIQVRDGEMALRLGEELTPWANPGSALGRDILTMIAQSAFLYGSDGAVALKLMQRDVTVDPLEAVHAMTVQALDGGYPVPLVARGTARLLRALPEGGPTAEAAATRLAGIAEGRWPDAAILGPALQAGPGIDQLAADLTLRLAAAAGERARVEALRPFTPLSDPSLTEELSVGELFLPGAPTLAAWSTGRLPSTREIHLVMARLFQERMNRPRLERRQELDRIAITLAELPARARVPWTRYFADVEMHTMLAMLEQASALPLRDRLLQQTEGLSDLPAERKLFLFAWAPGLLQSPALAALLQGERGASVRLAIAAFHGDRPQVERLLSSMDWSPLTISALIEVAYLFGFDSPDL